MTVRARVRAGDVGLSNAYSLLRTILATAIADEIIAVNPCTSPRGFTPVGFPGGVKVRVTWLLLIDNANRRWIIRPLGGTRAHRIKWWWRPDQKSMPRKW